MVVVVVMMVMVVQVVDKNVQLKARRSHCNIDDGRQSQLYKTNKAKMNACDEDKVRSSVKGTKNLKIIFDFAR